MKNIKLVFHTRTQTIAEFDNFTDALAFQETLSTNQGVAVTLPQGGEINAGAFAVWARVNIRKGLIK